MIQAQSLTKWYGPTLAVDSLSFEIPRGQIVGFLGPNGAGKTTTLRMLTGYLPPTEGQAMIAGHNVADHLDTARKCIGYLPENTPLYPEMRVEEYLRYRGTLMGMGPGEISQRIGVVTERCGLSLVRRRVIGHLSRGNKQRVGLAQALLHNPPVLILDEPTAGLDPIQIVHIRQLLSELRSEHTILLSSHILTEIERIADRVMVIGRGRLIADGHPETLVAKVSGASRVIVEVKTQPQSLKRALEGIEGVGHVESHPQGDYAMAVVTPKGSQDLREAVISVVSRNNWALRELRRPTATLEDFYLQAFKDLDNNTHKISA
ncbi:MAG: ATP-binding cassette domain-containing protein [Phycisphaera sp.]|nr:ATP-binding cassette domain-containing protein [Phycisphaera sp.]